MSSTVQHLRLTPPTPLQVVAPEREPERMEARVELQLQNGERIEVGVFEIETAKERARALMAELQAGTEWPYVSGRYVRPEAVVSIDVELTGARRPSAQRTGGGGLGEPGGSPSE